ncbi:hypothetical protein MLD38_015042 [Melastoma candidum]|uniref:Uncharacterized protein n=1 Tax=Melastoma candidum TaxID=119954 RepID=A0ACB9REX0_9MYRT|nr:hypothetical protein MLD38_015042 [Melastoma candidum]
MSFDFSDNCVPGRDLQRPRPQSIDVPGVGLSCLRIPSVQQKRVDCGAGNGFCDGYDAMSNFVNLKRLLKDNLGM